MLETIIGLLGGALGGNGAGALLKKFSLGTVGNSVVGILGGLAMKYIPQLSGLINFGGEAAGSGDMMSIVSNLVSGGVGGGVLMTVVGLVKNMMKK